MIPVQVLAGYLAIFKLDDSDDGNLDAFAGRRNAWNQPIHYLIVRKVVHRLIDKSIFSHNLRDGYRHKVGRDLNEKAIVIEIVDSIPPPAAYRERRHQDVRIL